MTKPTNFFLCTQGQAVDSEHLSEYTEEESDTPVATRLTGFLRWDLLYLRPILIRRVTHQEVCIFIILYTLGSFYIHVISFYFHTIWLVA